MKAFIITMSDNAESLRLAKMCKESILETDSVIQAEHYEAVQPKDFLNATLSVFDEFIPWTWPTEDSKNGIDFKTNLYLKTYPSSDQNRVKACALSHFKLWRKCAEDNETIVVLEHDALFTKKFDPNDLVSDPSWGAVGLNDPRGNTRKGMVFHRDLDIKPAGIYPVPVIDTSEEPPLPMGLAGNSAYIIRPYAARELLKVVKEVGMWPNDAILCRQLFTWLRVTVPYYTNTQRNVSSTTSL